MSDYILPDVLQSNLKIVFCGTAASAKSARVCAYYAGPGNRFWETLYTIGLTPYKLNPQEFITLPKYSIGLTDLAKYVSGNDSVLSRSDFDMDTLRLKIMQYTPHVLALTSKRAASLFFNQPTHRLTYGLQTRQFQNTSIFILPSPSGAARGYWDIKYWQILADFVSNR